MSKALKDGKKSLPMKKQKKTKSSMILSRSKRIRILAAKGRYSRRKYSRRTEICISCRFVVRDMSMRYTPPCFDFLTTCSSLMIKKCGSCVISESMIRSASEP